jgi:DNA-binding MarR family transcriptional regulator
MDNASNIINLLTRIQERSNPFRHGREDIFDDMSLAEVHCIDWIGTLDYANVTKVANEMGLTRGGICKISKKLLTRGFIDSYQRPDNNKEIYYRLTESGRCIFDEHKKCHSKTRQEKSSLLEAYSEAEQTVILRFLEDINRLYDNKQADDTANK